jgi:SAM-dependent methyltransferase
MTGSVPQIFSRARRNARWRRAVARQSATDPATFVFEALAEELADRLGFMRHEAERVLVLGDPVGLSRQVLGGTSGDLVCANPATLDEEHAIDRRYDLIASLGLLDTVNDLPGALLHLRHALAEDGLLIAGFVGAGSLANLRRAMLAAEPDRPAARMHPMIDVRAASGLMQRAGFRRQVVDSFPLKVRYGTLERLIGDLRDQGLTGVLASAPPPLTRAGWRRAREAFRAGADPDGKVTETFELVVMTGWG